MQKSTTKCKCFSSPIQQRCLGLNFNLLGYCHISSGNHLERNVGDVQVIFEGQKILCLPYDCWFNEVAVLIFVSWDDPNYHHFGSHHWLYSIWWAVSSDHWVNAIIFCGCTIKFKAFPLEVYGSASLLAPDIALIWTEASEHLLQVEKGTVFIFIASCTRFQKQQRLNHDKTFQDNHSNEYFVSLFVRWLVCNHHSLRCLLLCKDSSQPQQISLLCSFRLCVVSWSGNSLAVQEMNENNCCSFPPSLFVRLLSCYIYIYICISAC